MVKRKSLRERGGRLSAFPVEYVTVPLTVLAAVVVIMSFTGLWPEQENVYNSYTLQACAWLDGRLDVENRAWLELAVCDGRYYVSFPPFPSYVMLPFAAICGEHTPDHLISLAVTLIGAIYAVRLYRNVGRDMKRAAFFALFLYLGNGYLFIAMRGWVWFIAQSMCFTLSLMALSYAVEGRGGRALLCWACAVGCRPMVALYLPLLAHTLWRAWRAEHPMGTLRQMIRAKGWWVLAPAVLAISYMALNFMRFGSILEFGHNYLPEFTRTQTGQFSFGYAGENVKKLLRIPEPDKANGVVSYPRHEGMAFFLVDPMLVVAMAGWPLALVRRRRGERVMRLVLPALLAAHAVIICCHRTLGGWQFGNRYLLDLLPYVYFGLIRLKPEDERFAQLCLPLFVLGAALNLVGTVGVYNAWI